MIPFGEYLPDLPTYQNSGATIAKNVIPLSVASYGPLSSLIPITAAMTNRCQGAYTGKDYAATVYTFAGDVSKLWHLKSDYTWEDLSKAAGYTVAADSMWEFVQYGNRVVAVAWGNNLQSYVMGTSALFADLSATAPQARYVAIIRDFLVVANTYDGVGGNQPTRVWWPAIDDPTNWPTPGTAAALLVQSDYQNLAEGGWIQGIVGAVGGADGAVFMEEAIYRMGYEGPPTVFRFDKVEKQRGTVVPGSIINVGTAAFYLGHDGFFAFDGSQSVPIGFNKIDKTFYNDYDPTYYYRVVAAADIVNKIVVWAYPGVGNTGGRPNRLLIYNWAANRWSLAELDIEYILRSYSASYTLDGLDATGYNIDTLPYSLDSRYWTGGSLLFSGIDQNHKLGIFSGSSLAASLETGEIDGGKGQRLFVTGIRPLVDGGTVTAGVGYRDTTGGTTTYTAATAAGADGICPQRISARYARAQVNIAAAGTWTHAQGVEVNMQPDGER